MKGTKELKVERVGSIIPKPSRFSGNGLKDHLKAIGQRIIEDADTLHIPLDGTLEVDVTAEVSPTEATVVKWTIVRVAEPSLIKLKEGGRE